MNKYCDGNTGNERMVYLKKGIIHSSLPLDIEYTHDHCAFKLGLISSQLLDMAQRFYDELNLLKDEVARLSKRPERPKLKPSSIAKEYGSRIRIIRSIRVRLI